MRKYNSAGFTIKRINCDQEFQPIMDLIKDDMDIEMNYAPAQAHTPRADQNNCVLQERIWAMFHWLPYKAMPKIMCQAAGMIAAHQLNLFPAKGGLSLYYSPNVILTGEPLDYNKHFQIPFGSYVQANHKPNPKNTTAPSTLDAIYLRPTGNLQGGMS